MPFRFTCPHCGTTTDLPDQHAGQGGLCANCGKTVTYPPPTGESPPSGIAERPKRGRGVAILKVAVTTVALLTVLGMVVGLFLPAVNANREGIRCSTCLKNLHLIGLAMHNYHNKYGCFPPAYIADENGKPKHSWRVLILPFMKHGELYSQYRFDEPWNSPHNMTLAARMPEEYCCPSAFATASTEMTSYAMIVGPHTISDGPHSRRMADITDGPKNTIMVVEATDAGINWMEPRDLDVGKMTFRFTYRGDETKPYIAEISSAHPAVANVLFCDGSVRSVENDIEPKALEAMTTIDGGETIERDVAH